MLRSFGGTTFNGKITGTGNITITGSRVTLGNPLIPTLTISWATSRSIRALSHGWHWYLDPVRSEHLHGCDQDLRRCSECPVAGTAENGGVSSGTSIPAEGLSWPIPVPARY